MLVSGRVEVPRVLGNRAVMALRALKRKSPQHNSVFAFVCCQSRVNFPYVPVFSGVLVWMGSYSLICIESSTTKTIGTPHACKVSLLKTTKELRKDTQQWEAHTAFPKLTFYVAKQVMRKFP